MAIEAKNYIYQQLVNNLLLNMVDNFRAIIYGAPPEKCMELVNCYTNQYGQNSTTAHSKRGWSL